MVISPSRPDLRPVAPPPLGGSVRHHLPLPHPGSHPHAGRGQPRHRFPHFHNPISEIQNPCPIPPPIKAHRASSRQTRNIPWHPASRPGTAPSVSIRVHLRSNSLLRVWRFARFPPKSKTRNPCPIPPIKTIHAPSSPATKWRYAAESWHQAYRSEANPSAATSRARGELFQTRAGSTAPAPSTALGCD